MWYSSVFDDTKYQRPVNRLGLDLPFFLFLFFDPFALLAFNNRPHGLTASLAATLVDFDLQSTHGLGPPSGLETCDLTY